MGDIIWVGYSEDDEKNPGGPDGATLFTVGGPSGPVDPLPTRSVYPLGLKGCQVRHPRREIQLANVRARARRSARSEHPPRLRNPMV